ncbi:MAG: hypothetical protein M3Y37_05320, partial [Chloroflexota bacterium]|nr:hypothetical protein [Chloroflexota bacterium]
MSGRIVQRIVTAIMVSSPALAGIVTVGSPNRAAAAAGIHYLFGSGSQTGGKRITLRVQITEPAPAGGAIVELDSMNTAIDLPATVTVPQGETELEFTAGTDPVRADTNVQIAARANGITKSRVVLIKAPVLTSISVQGVIRGGGQGKVIIRMSGPAPAGGLEVTDLGEIQVATDTSPAGVLLLDSPVVIPVGLHKVSLAVPAVSVQSDTPVDVTASMLGRSFTRTTIVRNFSTTPPPTATPSFTPTATSTATDLPPTATNTPTST